MTKQQYRVIADRDKGDDPKYDDAQPGDRLTFTKPRSGLWLTRTLDRIERPVPTTDEPSAPELVTLHLYRDTCVGGLFLSERELDRTLHERVEALTIRRDRLPSPSVPTREQIAEVLHRSDESTSYDPFDYDRGADAVIALLNGTDR